MKAKIYVVLLAGGSGTRMHSNMNKVLMPIAGLTCISRSAEAFRKYADKMVLVCRKEDRSSIQHELDQLHLPFPVIYVLGGKTRQDSVAHGLAALPVDGRAIVLIHDGARCLVSGVVIQRVIDSVIEQGSGVASIPVTDTIKQIEEDNSICKTIAREQLRAVQTPQGFWLDELRAAHQLAASEDYQGTDDASLMEYAGYRVFLSPGSYRNLKITTKEDLKMAEALLSNPSVYSSVRIGHGYDVHQLCEGRKLILCGVEIPHSAGLLGHSDADVAVHALIDALLGAAGLGDIGRHFPDTDAQYKDISSILLLHRAIEILRIHGFHPSNVDITIIAQRPKLAPYIPQMTEKIAQVIQLPTSRVNIKATTTEKLGFEGRMEGISSQAVCLIQSDNICHGLSEEMESV